MSCNSLSITLFGRPLYSTEGLLLDTPNLPTPTRESSRGKNRAVFTFHLRHATAVTTAPPFTNETSLRDRTAGSPHDSTSPPKASSMSKARPAPSDAWTWGAYAYGCSDLDCIRRAMQPLYQPVLLAVVRSACPFSKELAPNFGAIAHYDNKTDMNCSFEYVDLDAFPEALVVLGEKVEIQATPTLLGFVKGKTITYSDDWSKSGVHWAYNDVRDEWLKSLPPPKPRVTPLPNSLRLQAVGMSEVPASGEECAMSGAGGAGEGV